MNKSRGGWLGKNYNMICLIITRVVAGLAFVELSR